MHGPRADAKEQRAEKAVVYSQLHLLALHRFKLRAYDFQQGYRLAGPDGTIIEPVPPEPPLTKNELRTLDFNAPRVASDAVMAAVKLAQEEHARWANAVRNYAQTTDDNRMYLEAGNLAATTSGQQIAELIEKQDKAAAAAKEADTALIEIMHSETSSG